MILLEVGFLLAPLKVMKAPMKLMKMNSTDFTAAQKLVDAGQLPSVKSVLAEPVAAVSVGIIDGEPRLDLPYVEDSQADVDMNIVMTASGKLVEVQGTAEKQAFSRQELTQLLDLASLGIEQIIVAQRACLK